MLVVWATKASRGTVKPTHFCLAPLSQQIIWGGVTRLTKTPYNTSSLILTFELVPSCVFPYTSGERKLMSIHKNV